MSYANQGLKMLSVNNAVFPHNRAGVGAKNYPQKVCFFGKKMYFCRR
jgi:hypothetical protein